MENILLRNALMSETYANTPTQITRSNALVGMGIAMKSPTINFTDACCMLLILPATAVSIASDKSRNVILLASFSKGSEMEPSPQPMSSMSLFLKLPHTEVTVSERMRMFAAYPFRYHSGELNSVAVFVPLEEELGSDGDGEKVIYFELV